MWNEGVARAFVDPYNWIGQVYLFGFRRNVTAKTQGLEHVAIHMICVYVKLDGCMIYMWFVPILHIQSTHF
jgi:hypothetical protein